MKTLLKALAVAVISLSFVGAGFAGDMMKDCVHMKGGKMMMMKDGKEMAMEKEMTMTDGTMLMKDGKKMSLKDGDKVMMDGTMMKHEMKEGMEHKEGEKK